MKPIFQKLMLLTLASSLTACINPSKDDSLIEDSESIRDLISHQQYCTVSPFDSDVSSTFSSFNGDIGSFTLNVAGTDAGTLNGTLSGDMFTITSGTITHMGFTVDVTGGSLDFTNDGQSAVGDMELDLMGESMVLSLKLDRGDCNLPELAYASPLPTNVITTNYLSLSSIESVSKFRSGAGHDFVDEFEACRSMKHYYNFDGGLSFAARASEPYYSPVDGEITAISVEGTGTTVHLRPSSAPYLYVEIFHVDLDPALEVGSMVNSGDQIGTHFSYGADGGNSDIAVWVRRPDGYRLISQFEIMSAGVLSEFTARGVTDWSTELYFETTAPHLSSLQCDNQEFSAGTDVTRDYFTLN